MRISGIVLTLLTCLSFLLNATENNLLINGDFSLFNSENAPNNWRVEGMAVSKSSDVGVNELHLTSQFKYNKYYVSLSQSKLFLRAGSYLFSGEIKGNVHTIYLIVSMPKGVTPPNRLITFKLPNRAKEWTNFSLAFEMPNENQNVSVELMPCTSGANDVVAVRKLCLVRTGDTAAPEKAAPKTIQSAPVPAKSPDVEITGTLVSRPAAASQVIWPKHEFCGKEYWLMLEPIWREMKGLSGERFIQDAGVRGIGTPWEPVQPYRRTGIREIEIWQDGKNVAGQTKLLFSSDERETKFLHPEYSTDGKMNSIGWIIGPTQDFRFRNKGVPFRVDIVLPSDKPVEKVVFYTTDQALPVRECSVFSSEEGEELSVSSVRKPDSLTLTFSKAPRMKSLYLKGMTQHTVYRAGDLTPAQKELVKGKPFTSPLFTGVLKFKDQGELNLENVDRDSTRRFRSKYPNFIPEQHLEASANFYQRRVYKSREMLEQQSAVVSPYDRNRFETAETLRKYWTRLYDLFGSITMLEGGLFTMPYYYEWGAQLTFPEAFNENPSYSSNRHLLTYARSGSRQYNRPWGFYETVFGGMTHADSNYSEAEAHRLGKSKNMLNHPGEDFGVSPSYHLRLLMLAYYAGSNLQQFECEPYGYAKKHENGSWTLTGNGQSIKKVYDWIVRPEAKRGDFYAPILLLNDYHSGNWEWQHGKEWNVWYMFPYEDGDYMIRHLLDQIDPPIGDFKKMQELSNGMRNSKFADMYDIFFANAPSGVVTPEELGKYPVVFLMGEIRDAPGLSENLQGYVKDGGTLVINASQMKLLPEKFAGIRMGKEQVISNSMKIMEVIPDGAEVLVKDSCGLPLITRYRNGNGSVILTTPYYLLNIHNKKECLPIIPALLEKLQSEVMPVSVKGDIMFCFNKMSGKDWKLILINNKGTFKDTMRTEEKFFPEYAQTVKFSLPAGASAKEVRLNLPVKVSNNQAEVTVPPGDVAVVELKNIPFTDTPINASPFNRKPSDPNKTPVSLNPRVFFSSEAGEGGYNINTEKRENALYLPGKDSGVIFTTEKVKQTPMPEGGYCCFAKPDSAKGPMQIVISNEYTRVDIVNGYWQLFFYDLRQIQSLKGPSVDPSKWTHLAVTWKDNQAHFYVDGKEVESEQGPLLFGGRCDGVSYEGTVCIYLGTFHTRRERLFKGLIRSVNFFGVAPDADEIKKLASEK